jgi:hypothetical protein
MINEKARKAADFMWSKGVKEKLFISKTKNYELFGI